MNQRKTRAGLMPAKSNEEPFDPITTERAQGYLNDRLRAVINKMNAANDRNKQVDTPEMALATHRFSKNFAPLVIAFSMDAVDKKNTYNIPEIFNPEPEDNSVKLRPEVYSVVYPYLYNAEDIKGFFTPQTKHDLQLTTKACREIKAASKFAITEEKDGGRKIRYVHVLIDPLRLFHDMLTEDDKNNEKFTVRISSITPISDTNFRYDVAKQYKKGGSSPEKSTIAKYLAKAIRR